MIPYTSDDYKKYVYAKGIHRIARMEEVVEAVAPNLTSEVVNDLQTDFDEARTWLWMAAFTADDNQAEADALRDGAWARMELDGIDPEVAEAHKAAGTYSDGRPVTTTFRWGEGESDYVTHIWHPDPLHPRNQAGTTLHSCEGPYPWRHRWVIITAPGVLDVVDEGALLLDNINEDDIGGVFDDK